MIATHPFDYAAQVTVPVPQCPVCETPQASHPMIDRYGFTVGLSACQCGLVYLNPRMTAEGYHAFYRDVYRALLFERYGAVTVEAPEACAARGRQIGHLLRQIGATGNALLDVGGGTGGVAAAIQDVIPVNSVTVLDPNDGELQAARARGYQTISGVVETQPPPTTQYDLIVCAQTADHWLEPLRALRWLRSALAPTGRLYIDIVDASEWRKRQPLGHFKIDHPLYWVPQAFRLALARTGWRIVARATGLMDKRRRLYWCKGA